MLKIWSVYLSGEIHSDWRERIMQASEDAGLPLAFYSAITNHDASDAAGDFLRPAEPGFWRDHQSSKVNGIRTRTQIKNCDVAVIRFGSKYKQWNAAFDAGQLAALGKPYITLHGEDLVHALKEVDSAAQAWATTTDQVVDVLEYVTNSPPRTGE